VRHNPNLLLAFDEALDNFGQDTKTAILHSLKERYGIAFDMGSHLPLMEQVEAALVDMFGLGGAEALLKNMEKKLGDSIDLVKT
jgi:hypothetical protein